MASSIHYYSFIVALAFQCFLVLSGLSSLSHTFKHHGVLLTEAAKYDYSVTRKLQGLSLNSICMAASGLTSADISVFTVQTLLVGNKKLLMQDSSETRSCIMGLDLVLVSRSTAGLAIFTSMKVLPAIVEQTAFSVPIMRAMANDTIIIKAENAYPNRALLIRGLGRDSLLLEPARGLTAPTTLQTSISASSITFPVSIQDVGDYLDDYYTRFPVSGATKASIVLAWNATSTSWVVSYVVHTQTKQFGIVAILVQATFYVPDSRLPGVRKLLHFSGRNLLQYSGGSDTSTFGCTMTRVLINPRPSYCVRTYSGYPNCLYRWVCK